MTCPCYVAASSVLCCWPRTEGRPRFAQVHDRTRRLHPARSEPNLRAVESAGAELLAYLDQAVVGLGLADGHPDPVLAVLAHHQARLMARRGEVRRVRAEREP